MPGTYGMPEGVQSAEWDRVFINIKSLILGISL